MAAIYSKADIGGRTLTDILGYIDDINDEIDQNEASDAPSDEIRKRAVKLHNAILMAGLELQPYAYCLSRI